MGKVLVGKFGTARPFFVLAYSDVIIKSNSEELKSKLRDRSSSFVCQRREGCTLCISLRPSRVQGKPIKAPLGTECESLATTHAIVAFRVLVGSSLGNVPSRITVQGRPVELSPRVKKWYSLPLTNEEIVMGIRSGFITLGIGPPSDAGTHSGIDAVEVYARERKDVSPWIEKFYFDCEGDGLNQSFNASTLVASTKQADNPSSNGLLLGARALASFCELSPELMGQMDEEQKRCVQAIVEETAYTPDMAVSQAMHELIRRLEPDAGLRGSIFDESLLRGWMRSLVDVGMALPPSPWEGEDGKARWTVMRRFLLNCLGTVSQIARDQPMIYLRCMDVFEIKNPSVDSVALQMLRYVCEACRLSLPCLDVIDGASGIVSLCLTEAAIKLNTERTQHLAGFDDVMALLDADTPDLSRKVCDALSGFCRRSGDSEEEEANIFRTLQGARLVAYQCDSCGLCPMKDVRYTCLEDSFDIE